MFKNVMCAIILATTVAWQPAEASTLYLYSSNFGFASYISPTLVADGQPTEPLTPLACTERGCSAVGFNASYGTGGTPGAFDIYSNGNLSPRFFSAESLATPGYYYDQLGNLNERLAVVDVTTYAGQYLYIYSSNFGFASYISPTLIAGGQPTEPLTPLACTERGCSAVGFNASYSTGGTPGAFDIYSNGNLSPRFFSAESLATPGYYYNGFGNLNERLAVIQIPGAVPEPATWAMLVAGFGFVGSAMRRRKRMSERCAEGQDLLITARR